MRSLSKLTAFDTQEAFFFIRHVNSPFRIAGRLASPSLSEDVRKGGTKNALCVQDVDCMLDNSKYANNEKCVNLIQNAQRSFALLDPRKVLVMNLLMKKVMSLVTLKKTLRLNPVSRG